MKRTAVRATDGRWPPVQHDGGGPAAAAICRLLGLAGLGHDAGYDRLLGRNGLALDDLDGGFDGNLAHLVRILGDDADHDRIVLNGVTRLFHAVEADDFDLTFQLGGLHGGSRSKSGIVTEAEDADDVGVCLQHVLCSSQSFRTGDTRLDGSDLDVRILFQTLLEAFDAINDRLHGRIVDDGYLALAADALCHQLGRALAAGEIVRADEGGDIGIDSRDVDGDDLDTGLLSLLDRRAHALAIDRRNDDHVDTLGDKVLDVGELLGKVLIGDSHFQRNLLRLSFLLHRIRERNVERVLLRQERRANTFRGRNSRHQGKGRAGKKNTTERFAKHDFLQWPALPAAVMNA
ncbi:monosaccharide-transporting ATPase [Rhizobium freirei PRF 81]|uniref:Monosaccharide-transporting ATPase n=1 Tax=Rhizobium freirei PRF 81 TaxID=363754 RepID=N6VAK8_9HYPH|nr:monosaccharide-transporting ATPase [Rhizobium freirei PRF 81]